MKMHKLSFAAVLALGGLLACANLSTAQDTNAPKKAPRRGPPVQQRVDRLAAELKLTDDQKAKVTTLLENQNKSRTEIFSDPNLTQEQRREKMRGLTDEESKKMKEILTPEQQDKYQKMREQMRQRRGENAGAEKKAPEKKAE